MPRLAPGEEWIPAQSPRLPTPMSITLCTLVRELGGRRIDRLSPEDSLILMKASGRMRHQGGGASWADAIPHIRFWPAGLPRGLRHDLPARRSSVSKCFRETDASFRERSSNCRPAAHFKDGSVHDVTAQLFGLHLQPDPEPRPHVTTNGMVRFSKTAEASILVRYLDQITSVRLTYVEPDPQFAFKGPPPASYIDEHVFAKQRELQLSPAPVADDDAFSVRPGLPRPDRRAAHTRGSTRIRLIPRMPASVPS